MDLFKAACACNDVNQLDLCCLREEIQQVWERWRFMVKRLAMQPS